MSAMTAEQAVFLLQDVYLGSLKNESRITKKVLEAVPTDKCEHRPDPVSKSAIELVRHIAVAENRFLETVINGVFDVNAAALPENVKTPQEVATWYEQRFKEFRSAHQAQRRSAHQNGRFPWYVPAPGRVFRYARHGSYHSPPRPAFFLLALYGRKSPVHLRRKLRRCAGAQSCRRLAICRE